MGAAPRGTSTVPPSRAEDRARRATPAGAGALLLALGVLATLGGWAALALEASGPDPQTRPAPLRAEPPASADLAGIPEVVPVDTTLPRSRPRPDVVTTASR